MQHSTAPVHHSCSAAAPITPLHDTADQHGNKQLTSVVFSGPELHAVFLFWSDKLDTYPILEPDIGQRKCNVREYRVTVNSAEMGGARALSSCMAAASAHKDDAW